MSALRREVGAVSAGALDWLLQRLLAAGLVPAFAGSDGLACAPRPMGIRPLNW